LASSWVDITTKPRRRDALSTVARITACATVPKRENKLVNSALLAGEYDRCKNQEYTLGEIKGQPKYVEISTHIRTLASVWRRWLNIGSGCHDAFGCRIYASISCLCEKALTLVSHQWRNQTYAALSCHVVSGYNRKSGVQILLKGVM
jgi:hypothetical protein